MAKDKQAYIALIPLMFTKGVTRIFSLGERPKAESGVGFLGRGSNPLPTS